MANLLAFEKPEESQLAQSPLKKVQTKYGSIQVSVNLNPKARNPIASEEKGLMTPNRSGKTMPSKNASTTSSTAKLVKKVGIDLSMVDNQPS